MIESAAYGTENTKYPFLIKKVEEIRDHVNRGHWDLLKHQTDKLSLIGVFLQFIKGIVKPILTDEELRSLGDISVSSVIDHAHMGFLTIFADMLGTLIFYRKSLSRMKEILESASQDDIERSMNLYEMELEQRKNSVQIEESIYQNAALLILSKPQQSNEVFIKTVVSQLRLLNTRKEDIYNKDDLKEFEQLSPIKRMMEKSLKPSALHE